MVLPNKKEVKRMSEYIAAENERIKRRKKSKFTDEERKKHCKDYQHSGLTLKNYGELNKISESALRKWMKKFASKTFFASVSPRPFMNSPHKQSFEIIFSNGIRLRFPELVDLSVIKNLIKEVGLCN